MKNQFNRKDKKKIRTTVKIKQSAKQPKINYKAHPFKIIKLLIY